MSDDALARAVDAYAVETVNRIRRERDNARAERDALQEALDLTAWDLGSARAEVERLRGLVEQVVDYLDRRGHATPAADLRTALAGGTP